MRPDTGDEEVQLLTQRLTPGLGGYLVLIAAGIFLPVIAVIGYLAIAVYYIIPFRRLSARFLPRRRRLSPPISPVASDAPAAAAGRCCPKRQHGRKDTTWR